MGKAFPGNSRNASQDIIRDEILNLWFGLGPKFILQARETIGSSMIGFEFRKMILPA